MAFKIRKATREKVKLKIGMQGPSGSGKTYGSLLLAHGITGDWTKIAVADTENKSAEYYTHLGPFNVYEFEPPYHPDRYCEVIEQAVADGIECLIIDSISHEWDGKGGCLQLHEQVTKGQKFGNSYTAWAQVTPLHNKFIDTMRISPLHIIACMRSKQDYVIEQNEKGKSVPKKVGLKGIQREGMDYEMGLVFEINMEHMASSSKDRTGLFAHALPFLIGEDTGKTLAEWANEGGTPEEEQIIREGASKALKGKIMVAMEAGGVPQEKMKDCFAHILEQEVSFYDVPSIVEAWKSQQTDG